LILVHVTESIERVVQEAAPIERIEKGLDHASARGRLKKIQPLIIKMYGPVTIVSVSEDVNSFKWRVNPKLKCHPNAQNTELAAAFRQQFNVLLRPAPRASQMASRDAKYLRHVRICQLA
jgi:hypothetical protein